MITILIAEDENKAKETLIRILKEEGYVLPDIFQDGVIRVVRKDYIHNLSVMKDKVIEIEESLFEEKRGTLYKSVLEAIEKPLIEQALKRAEGNQLKAARILGINRNTMHTKIERLGIDISLWKTRWK
ncbi:MAG: hypothetical protein NC923_08190 [Candidatus Omnitrophica bacterium]|nr:hypothetical protein [Candidatus Omnitrophota bacterium]